MAQALTNSINLNQDNILTTQPKNNDVQNFDKLFQKQSDQINSTTKINQFNEKKDMKTIGNLKKELSSTLSDLEKFLEKTTDEVIQESALNIALLKNIQKESENSELSTDSEIPIIQTENLQISEEMPEELPHTDTTIITSTSPLTTNQNSTTDIKTEEEELKVTINGLDIESYFDDLGLSDSAEEDFIITNSGNSEDIEGVKIEDIIEQDALKELNIEKIEAEVSSDNGEAGENLMQNQTPQEHSVKAMIQGGSLYKEIEITTSAKTQVNTVLQQYSSTDKIIEQISKQLSNINTTSRVNIVLNPESLGKVALQIANTSEGLSAQFTVATQEAKDIIMKGLDGLKEALLSQGINVDNVAVKLNHTQKGEYNQDLTEQEGSNGGNKQQKEHHPKEEQNFEQLLFGLDDKEKGNV